TAGAERTDRGGAAAEAAAAATGGDERGHLPATDDGRGQRTHHGVDREGPPADRGGRAAVLHRDHRVRGRDGGGAAGERAPSDPGSPGTLPRLHRRPAAAAAYHDQPAEGGRG